MPYRPLIINASPLIFLSRAGGLIWLGKFSTDVVKLPRAVIVELLAGYNGVSIVDAIRIDEQCRIVNDIDLPSAAFAPQSSAEL